MDKQRQIIYLAALLHDIGKFYQRADVGLKEADISKMSDRMIDYICPKDFKTHRFGYLHVVWTHEFFEQNKAIFNVVKENGAEAFRINPFDEKASDQNKLDNLVSLAIYHHKPTTDQQKIIQLADWWSSGIDRSPVEKLETKDETEAHPPIKWGMNKYKKVPLSPIFLDVKVKKDNDEEKNKDEYVTAANRQLKHLLTPLSLLQADIFPTKTVEGNPPSLQNDYALLWKHFTDEFQNIPTDSISGFTETLFFLLKKYTWGIPSSTRDMPNVSLFEHLKTTAAIAQCLYDYYEANGKDFSVLKNTTHQPLLMVCADISGIQKFIYDIYSRKAAQSLKGRSFYLQLLIDSIIQKIITHADINATIGHVIYASGGKFYMLLPNIERVKKALKEIEETIVKEVFDQHKGALFVCLDFVSFGYQFSELKKDKDGKQEKPHVYSCEKDRDGKPINDLSKLWGAVSDKTGEKKKRKFSHLLISQFDDFFNKKGIGEGGDLAQEITSKRTLCAVTGEEIKRERENVIDDNLPENEWVYVSPVVKTQTKIGQQLKDAEFYLSYMNSELLRKPWQDIKVLSNLYYGLVKEDERTSSDASVIKYINSATFLQGYLKGKKSSYGFTFYGGNKQAEICAINEKSNRHEWRGKYFEELAGDENAGFKRLGILRMDVDGLGNIFTKGFGDDNKTFAAYSTLSGQLDLFFSGYLNTIRNKDTYKDWVNILYSGGDDVFAIGRWDCIIAFAEEVRNEFRKFVCGREEISISAGIVMVGAKFPIAKAADLAGEAEDQAKSYVNENLTVKKKNALSLFGEAISWENEFTQVKKWKEQLVAFMESNDLSAGFLQKLITFQQVKNQYRRELALGNQQAKPDLSYQWNSAYFIARYEDKFKGKQDKTAIVGFLTELKEELFCSVNYKQDRAYDLAAMAARWAALELRAKTKDNEVKE